MKYVFDPDILREVAHSHPDTKANQKVKKTSKNSI